MYINEMIQYEWLDLRWWWRNTQGDLIKRTGFAFFFCRYYELNIIVLGKYRNIRGVFSLIFIINMLLMVRTVLSSSYIIYAVQMGCGYRVHYWWFLWWCNQVRSGSDCTIMDPWHGGKRARDHHLTHRSRIVECHDVDWCQWYMPPIWRFKIWIILRSARVRNWLQKPPSLLLPPVWRPCRTLLGVDVCVCVTCCFITFISTTRVDILFH